MKPILKKQKSLTVRMVGMVRVGDWIIHPNSSTPCVITNEPTTGTGFVHAVSLNGSHHKIPGKQLVMRLSKEQKDKFVLVGSAVMRNLMLEGIKEIPESELLALTKPISPVL